MILVLYMVTIVEMMKKLIIIISYMNRVIGRISATAFIGIDALRCYLIVI